MDKKIEEMIALGAAYALNCQPCIEYHKQKAAETGLSSEEMRMAVRVADTVKKGAGIKAGQFAERIFSPMQTERCCPAGSECCP